jgi:predicted dinucleotide-binding enzyme
MAVVKTIAIIGATETMGSAIARSLSKSNPYRLLLMSDEPEKLADLRTEIEKNAQHQEVFAMSCAREASWEADIIIVATPYESEKEIAEKIREVATGKIVISISNLLNQSGNELATSSDTSAAEELQRLLPTSKVVKTFNTTFADNFKTTTIDSKTADVFIAGNNGNAVETVAEIVRTAGLNPIVAGDLSVSRTLERMRNNNWLAGWKILHS